MPRYTNVIETVFSEEEINNVVTQTLTQAKFKKKVRDGEEVWQKGGGLVAPQFIKVTAKNGMATVEGWLKFSILPGIYYGEMDLTGAMGFAIKDLLRKNLSKLEANIRNEK